MPRFLQPTSLARVFIIGLGLLPWLIHAGECGVGEQVQGEMGGGAIGTIAEVGTTSPHVGWYRIVFDWNKPNGDWYSPATWDVRPVGSDSRCVVGAAPVTTPGAGVEPPVRK